MFLRHRLTLYRLTVVSDGSGEFLNSSVTHCECHVRECVCLKGGGFETILGSVFTSAAYFVIPDCIAANLTGNPIYEQSENDRCLKNFKKKKLI